MDFSIMKCFRIFYSHVNAEEGQRTKKLEGTVVEFVKYLNVEHDKISCQGIF